MSISKIFIPYFLCVLTNERYKTCQRGFLFYRLGHAPRVGLWGTGSVQGAKKLIFFKNGHVVYKIDGDDEQNEMHLHFHPRVKLVTLGRGQKDKYH